MSPIPNRIIIYTKDIVNFSGRTDRTARNMLSRIRKHLNKPSKSPVTLEEFCDYYNINPENIKPFLK